MGFDFGSIKKKKNTANIIADNIINAKETIAKMFFCSINSATFMAIKDTINTTPIVPSIFQNVSEKISALNNLGIDNLYSKIRLMKKMKGAYSNLKL